MLKNHFKIAFRSLWRHKAFSAINVFGLAIGMATCLVIMLFVQYELSYDRFHEKGDRIVRVVFRGEVQGEKMNEAHVMPPTAQTLLADYPEVLEATRLRNYGTPRVAYEDKSFREDAFAFVDSNFFQVFTLPFLQGDPRTALLQPNTVVISEAVAQKYFGDEDPIGKVLNFKSFGTSCKITGVMEPVPANSHFHFDIFASMASLPEAREASWLRSEFYTYLVLPEGYDYQQLEAKLPQVVEKYMGPQMQQGMGLSLAQFREKGNDIGLFLQPLTDIYLHSDFMYDLGPRGDIRYVYLFGSIALFMLLIACINFMNLSTAGASKRAREVGIRKVLGSVKGQLVRQFLLESILLTAVSLLLAIILVEMALPVFNDLAGKNLNLPLSANLWLVPGLVLFGVFVGVLAGSYPAFFLSSFRPVAVLKGTFTAGKKSLGFRSGLVVFQFCISTALILSTTVVYQQLRYIQNAKVGYDKDQVLVLPETWVLGKQEEVFRQLILQDPRVERVSVSGYLPAGPTNNNNFFVYPGEDIAQQVKTLQYEVDDQYIPTLGMQLAAGRNFSKDLATDSAGIILNETAAKAFGWGENALGQTLTNDNGGKRRYRVIGVVKDFHFRSLHERISPLVMTLGNNTGTLIVKTKTEDIAGLLTSLDKQWTALTAEEPFVYSFLDERFNQTYEAEQKIGRILGISAGLTILVACLGLFGLATFTAEQRTKEIGIRKVLGASVASIVGLLSKDFLKLVLLSNLIAWPLAGWAMQKWLQDFEYRIDLEWWVFGVTGGLALGIALLTVSFQSIKAALMNPVKSLRSE
jgi:putative ABC transport system permease protein